MNDRELLERAAKAAGFGAPGSGSFCWTESEYPAKSGKNGALWNYVGYMDSAELWNPLADDGDALRLAVRLNMTVQCSYSSVWVERAVPATEVVETHNNKDPLAATRRAIVRAAATLADSEQK
jgi:hypothetical protein